MSKLIIQHNFVTFICLENVLLKFDYGWHEIVFFLDPGRQLTDQTSHVNKNYWLRASLIFLDDDHNIIFIRSVFPEMSGGVFQDAIRFSEKADLNLKIRGLDLAFFHFLENLIWKNGLQNSLLPLLSPYA